MEKNKEHRRIVTLDSLRGMAAVAVLFSHYSAGLKLKRYIDFTPLYFFKAAHEAVIFFFLLSGYVLVYQNYRQSHFNYLRFVILRFFRIYIPYIAAITLGFVLYFICRPIYYTDNFIANNWAADLDYSIFINHLIMVHNFNTSTVDGAIWSLVHEMRIALIFPALLAILRLDFYKIVIICSLIVLISSVAIVLNLNPSQGYNNSYCYTIYYFYVFVSGGLIAKYQLPLVNWFRQLSKRKALFFLTIALSLYTFSHFFSIIFNKLNYQILSQSSFALEDFLVVISSSFFMIAAIALSDSRTFLKNRVLLFLGKISYSIYLVHMLIAVFLFNELHNRFSMGVILALSLVISPAVSYVFNILIERNAAILGKIVSSKVK